MTLLSTLNRRDFINRSSFRATELDNQALARIAPSVLAEGAHESRSDRYTYVPTIQIVEALRGEGWGVFKASQSTTRVPGMVGHTKHMITLRRYADIERIQRVGDHVNQISILNSHNGTSKVIGYQGVWELVCLNGLLVSKGNSTEFKVAHKGDIVAGILQSVLEMAANFERVDAMRELMQTTELTPSLQTVFANQMIRYRFQADNVSDAPVTADQVLRARRMADQGNDAWRTLNRVQENLIRGGLRTRRVDANNRVRRGHSRELNGIDQNVATNRHIWASMEVMIAEIRGMHTPNLINTQPSQPVAAAARVEARAYVVQSAPADVVDTTWEPLTVEAAPALAPLFVQTRIAEPSRPAAAPEAQPQAQPTPANFGDFGTPAADPQPAQPERVLITGRTYPVRQHLRNLGGIWDALRKGWSMPAHYEQQARAIVARGY